MLKNPAFFNVEFKISYRQFLIFLSFMKKRKGGSFLERSKEIKQLFSMHSQRYEPHHIYKETRLL